MITDALLLVPTAAADEAMLAAKQQWLKDQGVNRVIVRDAGQGGAAAVKAIEEEGFTSSFFVVELDAPAADLQQLAKEHTGSWSCATQATDASGQPIGIYVFEFRIFDYIPRGEACELADLMLKLTEQDEAVLDWQVQ